MVLLKFDFHQATKMKAPTAQQSSYLMVFTVTKIETQAYRLEENSTVGIRFLVSRSTESLFKILRFLCPFLTARSYMGRRPFLCHLQHTNLCCVIQVHFLWLYI